MAESSPRWLTADMLADLEVPHEVTLSPSAEHVVYTLRADWNRPKGRWVSSLWIAEIGRLHSARQVTQGDSLDSWPQFSPNGKSIAFLSDRGREDVNGIWITDIQGGDAVALTSADLEQSVSKFAWSKDGTYIAFLSADEKKQREQAQSEKKLDPLVHGDDWEFARLRVLNVATKEVTTLVSKNSHIYDFVWSPDSKSIVYAKTSTPESSSAETVGTDLEIVKLDDRSIDHLSHFPAPLDDLCWISSGLWWRGPFEVDSTLSSKTVYKMGLPNKDWSRQAFGEEDCATTWALPPGLRQVSDESLVVQVQVGLADQLHLLPERTLLYDELHELKSYDAASKEGKTILVIVTSTGSLPNEVYSIINGETIALSNHGADVAKFEIAQAKPFYATAQDGTDIDGTLVLPKNHDASKPSPTVVLAHGGPYQRVSCGFDLPFFNASAWFASAGYVVLCPNYRGGSSHGNAHSTSIRGAAGTFEYSDTIDLIKAAIGKGIVDPKRVGIFGWSYGGYITYLAVTRDSTFHFQAAIAGAGVTDWDLQLMTYVDDTKWVSELAGTAPWGLEKDETSDTKNRVGSPIWHMQDIKTPLLILHGENDDGVPLPHAKGFYQGCLKRAVDCKMVVYPGEGHGMFPPFQRVHYVDMLERTRRFFDLHLLKAL